LGKNTSDWLDYKNFLIYKVSLDLKAKKLCNCIKTEVPIKTPRAINTCPNKKKVGKGKCSKY